MSTPDRVPVRDDLTDVEPYGAPQLEVPVRLNTNETASPPPQVYLDEVASRIRSLQLHRYPDRAARLLRARLAETEGLTADRVWAANGSNEVLLQLFQAYGGPGRRMLLFRPGYSAHPLIARVACTATVEHDLPDDFALSPEVAAHAVERHRPDVVVVASPSNPAGVPTPMAAIRALHDHGRALVVVDEAYVEFGTEPSARQLLDELPRLVVTRTFSKAYRLAGLRLGYLLAHRWVVDDVRKVRLPYHLDSITQVAAVTALELREQLLTHIPGVVAERDRLREGLERTAGIARVWPSQGNYLLFRTRVEDLFERLLAQGVLVRDFSTTPRLEGCLRVTVGTPEENDTFLEALRGALANSHEEAHA